MLRQSIFPTILKFSSSTLSMCAKSFQENIKGRKLQVNAPKIRTKKHASNRITNNGLVWKQLLFTKAELLTSKVHVERKNFECASTCPRVNLSEVWVGDSVRKYIIFTSFPSLVSSKHDFPKWRRRTELPYWSSWKLLEITHVLIVELQVRILTGLNLFESLMET